MGSSPDEDRTVVDRPTVPPADEEHTKAEPVASRAATKDRDAADASPTLQDSPGGISKDPPQAATPRDPTRSRPGPITKHAAPAVPRVVTRDRSLVPQGMRTPPPSTGTITTAIEAMRGEEVERTRTFIKLGWLATFIGYSTLPFVESTRVITIAFVVALAIGVIVSIGFYIAFRDPQRYTPRALFVLGVMSTINTHVAILFFGVFTLTSVLMVLGLHFVGRSELDARRAIYLTGVICHGLISLALISGVMPDPGVFATGHPLGVEAYVIGLLFTQAAYALAYYTGKSQRLVSLRSIEQLHRATRVASQRAALLEELRADLARAQQGGAGRYTDQVFAGFRLGQVLGRGAHGEVYEAAAEKSFETVAVKLLRRELLVDATQVARFLREARAMGSLASPNIVRVLAASEPDAPVPFLVMERLRGSTLSELLRRKNQLSRDEVFALITQIGAGLDAASAAGIVHRDLKPQNLFLDGALWKILDFGVATLNEAQGTLTQGGIIGTPQYMAPEQARGGRVDHRADLYALGTIAYRAVTGRNAFGGPDTPAILYAVVHTMPPRPSAFAEVHPDVDRWFALVLAKDPVSRFASGDQLATQLAAAFEGELEDRAAADRLIEAMPWQESA
jgi:tRNA A-37 threonylcarbamoyl transferase component Bud32